MKMIYVKKYFFLYLGDHLVDGVVSEVAGEFVGLGGNHLPLAAQVVVVHKPRLAVLQPAPIRSSVRIHPYSLQRLNSPL